MTELQQGEKTKSEDSVFKLGKIDTLLASTWGTNKKLRKRFASATTKRLAKKIEWGGQPLGEERVDAQEGVGGTFTISGLAIG